MSEAELRKHRCSFTGHRPEKLVMPEQRMAALLEAEIRSAVDRQFTTFISGMAKGVDYEKGKVMRSEISDAVRDSSR